MKKDVTVKVEASGHELMQHVAKLIDAYKQAVADGWNASQDIPALVMAVVAEGPGMISNIQAISGDLAESKIDFVKGVALGGFDIAEKFIPSAPVAPQA